MPVIASAAKQSRCHAPIYEIATSPSAPRNDADIRETSANTLQVNFSNLNARIKGAKVDLQKIKGGLVLCNTSNFSVLILRCSYLLHFPGDGKDYPLADVGYPVSATLQVMSYPDELCCSGDSSGVFKHKSN